MNSYKQPNFPEPSNQSNIPNRNGQVIIVEDDPDDQEMIKDIFDGLGYPNEVVFFGNGYDAFNYLSNSLLVPFLILCDINMPVFSGFQLKEQIQRVPHLKFKCIPYLFLSTHASKDSLHKAYDLGIQGYFQKPNSFLDLQKAIKVIMEYWTICISPGKYII